jgi:predicted transcriptional regulator
MKAVRYEDFLKQQLKNPKLRKEYDALEGEFTLAKEIIELRIKSKLTQKQLAQQIGTSQPAIARLESGSYRNVSLSFLRRIADALGAVPEIHLRKKGA